MGTRGSTMKKRPAEENEPVEEKGPVEEEGPAVDKEQVVEKGSVVEEKQIAEEGSIVEKKQVEDRESVEDNEQAMDEEPAVDDQPVAQGRPLGESRPEKRYNFSNWTRGTWERMSDDPTLRVVLAGASWSTEPGRLMNQFKGIGYVPEPRCGYEGGFKRKCTISHVEIDGETLVLQIWDGILGERDQVMKLLKGNRVGLMLLYDVRDKRTFERVKKYAAVDVHVKVFLPLSFSFSFLFLKILVGF